MVPVAYPAQSPRLLELVRESFRYKHYSLKTEETYVYWASFFVRRQKRPGAMRQPREMGTSEVLTDEHARLTATGRLETIVAGRRHTTRHSPGC